jgi:hypothetical protein
MAQAIDPERLADHFRRIRGDRELTLQQVSDQTNISVATISRV